VIPEASALAAIAMDNCKVRADCVVDDSAASYPGADAFDVDTLQTEGYASLLRIERGRLRHRDIFGPVRLHYGLFQLRARCSDYLLARAAGQIAGGIGFMVDPVEKAVRIFELISSTDEPIRFLLEQLIHRCQVDLHIEFIEVDVSAYSPRMQRTLLELDFEPVAYIPANVFHEVERLDAIKMVRPCVPFESGRLELCEPARHIADLVIGNFRKRMVVPQVARVAGQVPLFGGLNEEQRQRLISVCSSREFAAGERVFGEEEAAGTLYLILEGEVELSAHGRFLAVLSAGQCLGETALLSTSGPGPPRSVTAVSRTAVVAAAFPQHQLTDLIRRRPDIGLVMYRNLAADISRKLKDAGQSSSQRSVPGSE
jgi:hypothetical protein